MNKQIKFPLEMAEGVQVRNIEDLRQNFDVEKVISYFLDGKLQTWLEARYYEDEAEAVAALSKDDANLGKALSEIFDVEYAGDEADIEEIEWKNARLAKIKQLTDDDEIIRNADLVAFNQEELAALYDEGAEKIYLCEGEFTIPKSKQDLEYIEFGGATVRNRKPKQEEEKRIAVKSYSGTEFEIHVICTQAGLSGDESLVTSLGIKGTWEMVSDEEENVGQYIKISDDSVVYSASTASAGGLYFRTIGGEKQIIKEIQEEQSEAVYLVYADNEKVVWSEYVPHQEKFYSYYFDNQKITEFYVNKLRYKDITGIAAIYKDYCYILVPDDTWEAYSNAIWKVNMRNGTETCIVRDNVGNASWFHQGKIYFNFKQHHVKDENDLFYIDVSNDNVVMANNFKLPEGTPFEGPQNVQYFIHEDGGRIPPAEVKPVRWDE